MKYDSDPEIAAIQKEIETLNAGNLHRRAVRDRAGYLFNRLAKEYPWATLPYPRFETYREGEARERAEDRARKAYERRMGKARAEGRICKSCGKITRKASDDHRCSSCRKTIGGMLRAINAGRVDGLERIGSKGLESLANLGRLVEHKGPIN